MERQACQTGSGPTGAKGGRSKVDHRWRKQRTRKRRVLFDMSLDETGRKTRQDFNSTRQVQGLLQDFISSLASVLDLRVGFH